MNQWLTVGILVICLLNLLRMSIYLLSSDMYSLKLLRDKRRSKRYHLPTISVVIPAHNEEKTIRRAVESVYLSDYPANKLEVIVANDGSTDATADIVRQLKKELAGGCKIRLINRPNRGKATVLNHTMRRYAHNQLIMCLDADSFLTRSSLRNAAQHFRDRDVVALSSNVNIIEDGTVLTLVQRFEYLMCYQMKKGQALLGVEYIVGGIGSMFRRSMLKKVSYYDSNTTTEDIDLTLKIIVSKLKRQKIAYAGDSIVYTEAAHSLSELMRQRFRWKYGRSQTFLKNNFLFFSRNKRYSRRLTWFMLPLSLLQDLIFFFEPLVIGYFLYNALRYGDPTTFISALSVLTVYLLFNVWSSDQLSIRSRLRLSYYAPPMYLLMYVLSYVEYLALIKALILAPKLKASISARHITWQSPQRRGSSVA